MSSVKQISIFKSITTKKEHLKQTHDTNVPETKEMVEELDVSILSNEQKIAYELYKQGKNVFLTGPGGTGKTKLIQYFIQYSNIK